MLHHEARFVNGPAITATNGSTVAALHIYNQGWLRHRHRRGRLECDLVDEAAVTADDQDVVNAGMRFDAVRRGGGRFRGGWHRSFVGVLHRYPLAPLVPSTSPPVELADPMDELPEECTRSLHSTIPMPHRETCKFSPHRIARTGIVGAAGHREEFTER